MTATDVSPDADPVARLRRLEQGATPAEGLALFDDLPAVSVAEVLGPWRGSELPTGGDLDGLLPAFGWVGKRFVSAEEVQPLVFALPDGREVPIDSALVPFGLSIRLAPLLRRPRVASALRRAMPLLRARRPRARLRNLEYRGVVTAAMVYDTQPAIDVFRRVDADTLLGAMDLRGLATPLLFVLRRGDASTD